MKDMNTLSMNILDWGLKRGIVQNGQPLGQAVKMFEEATEVLDALSSGSKQDLIDAIGDVYVTLVMLAGTSGLSIEECVEHAWNQIKDRRGYLREDGIFVKDEA